MIVYIYFQYRCLGGEISSSFHSTYKILTRLYTNKHTMPSIKTYKTFGVTNDNNMPSVTPFHELPWYVIGSTKEFQAKKKGTPNIPLIDRQSAVDEVKSLKEAAENLKARLENFFARLEITYPSSDKYIWVLLDSCSTALSSWTASLASFKASIRKLHWKNHDGVRKLSGNLQHLKENLIKMETVLGLFESTACAARKASAGRKKELKHLLKVQISQWPRSVFMARS